MSENQEQLTNMEQNENVPDNGDFDHYRSKKVRHVFSEEQKNALDERSQICSITVYYRTERGDKLCGVCILEIGGERFSTLSIVRKHVRNNSNVLSGGYCQDCSARLYQFITPDICPDCK